MLARLQRVARELRHRAPWSCRAHLGTPRAVVERSHARIPPAASDAARPHSGRVAIAEVSRRRGVAVAVAVIVIAAVAAVANSRRAPHLGRSGSARLAAGQPVRPTAAPPAYRVDYKLQELIGDDVRTSTEKVWVRGPFESRL